MTQTPSLSPMSLRKDALYVITGVANHRSIAAHVLQQLATQQVPVLVTYQDEKLKKWVSDVVVSCGLSIDVCTQLDVSDDQSIAQFGEHVGRVIKQQNLAGVNYLLHSIAFAEKEDLAAQFSSVSRASFAKALDISCYSLIALTRVLNPYFVAEASVATLTYLGATQYVPHYNVMGVAKAALESSVRYLAGDLGAAPHFVRVNAISAGPVKTLAASGIKGFREMLQSFDQKTPLKSEFNQEGVAGLALFLASPLSRNISGQVLFVDNGFGMTAFNVGSETRP